VIRVDFAKSRIRSGRSLWCEALWKPVVSPSTGTRGQTQSRDILNGEHARDFRRERDRLQIDMIFTCSSNESAPIALGSSPVLAAAVERLDILNATLDLPDVRPCIGEPRAVGGADLRLETVDRRDDGVEDAAVLARRARRFRAWRRRRTSVRNTDPRVAAIISVRVQLLPAMPNRSVGSAVHRP